MNSQRGYYCELLVVVLELTLMTIVSCIVIQVLLVCLLGGRKCQLNLKALRAKQIMPYPLNKAFLAKLVNQNPNISIREPMVPYPGSVNKQCNSLRGNKQTNKHMYKLTTVTCACALMVNNSSAIHLGLVRACQHLKS